MSTIHYVELVPLGPGSDATASESYACRVNLRGNLTIENAYETSVLLKALVAGGLRRVLIGLEHLTYIDSTGIGAIIGVKKELTLVGGALALYNVPPRVAQALDLVNMRRFIPFFYAEREALEYLASPDPDGQD